MIMINWKLSKYQDLEDVDSEGKDCASYNWSIINDQEGISSESSVAPRSPVGQIVIEGRTNEHRTHHS